MIKYWKFITITLMLMATWQLKFCKSYKGLTWLLSKGPKNYDGKLAKKTKKYVV